MIQGCQTVGYSGYWGTRPSHQHDTLMGVYSGARGSPLSALQESETGLSEVLIFFRGVRY